MNMTQKPLQVKGVLFDLDGTLIDSLPDIGYSINLALADLGLNQLTLPQVQSYIGSGVTNLIELSLPQGREDVHFPACLELFRRYYQENLIRETTYYPGLPELVQQMADQGYCLGVMSNKTDALVKRLVTHFFGAAIPAAVGECAEIPRKPSPVGIQTVLHQLGLTTAQAVYVGDSPGDIITGHNAGLPVIAVTWGYRDAAALADADYLVHTTEELACLLGLDRNA